MITIEVRVSGGVAPVPIQVFIDRDANTHDDDIIIMSPISFKQIVPLRPATYAIVVSGKNPLNGRTEISITGTDSNDKAINFHKIKDVPNYSAVFIINI